jgi:hypothetical protein
MRIAQKIPSIIVVLISAPAFADGSCTLTAPLAAQVHDLIRPGAMLVHYCPPCGDSGFGPYPLRVREVTLTPSGPDGYWLDGQRYSAEDVRQAKENRTGALVDYLRRHGPVDDWIIDATVKSLDVARARRDHDLRINGEPIAADYVYLPMGGDLYENLAVRLRCAPDVRPTSLRYTLLPRDRTKEAAIPPFIVDVTGECHEGSCPGKIWQAIGEVRLFDKPGSDAREIAKLGAGEQVTAIRTLAYVTAVPAKVVWDHHQFFAGDMFYVLDSQGEGHYRVWHYGELVIEDLSATSLLVAASGRCPLPSGECWAEFADYPRQQQWTQVQRANGDEGWVLVEPESFDAIYADY